MLLTVFCVVQNMTRRKEPTPVPQAPSIAVKSMKANINTNIAE
jgi:hypothetical protein